MALTLNANFIAAAASGRVEPRYLVQLWVNATTSYKFLDGKCASVNYPESILKVVPVTRTLDTKTRKPSTSSSSVMFVRDQLWETILATYAVKGGYVDIKLGFEGLAEGDFEPHGSVIVENVRETESDITLVCKTLEKKLGDDDVFWQWIGLHPLQCARRILALSGIPNSRTDLTALDPATYSADISHFVCSRVSGGDLGIFGGTMGVGATNAMMSPQPASELLGDIAQMLGGSFHDNEAGEITFTKFDPSTAAVDNWTEDDISDLVVEPLYENLANKITVNSHPYVFTSGEAGTYGYVDQDATSQAEHAIVVPGGVDEANIKEMPVNTDWIAGVAQLYTDFTAIAPANGQAFEIQGWATHAFCGTAWGDITHGPPGAPTDFYSSSDYPNGAQNAEHAVSAARPIYVRIGSEIIKCTDLTVLQQAGMWAQNTDTDTNYSILIPHRLQLTIAAAGGRGALSTTPAIHSGIDGGGDPDLIFDITVQRWVANLLLTRWKNGGQIIRCRTGLDKYKVQRGDLVTLTLPASRYRAKGKAGLSTTTKFEVGEKALDIYADPPGLQWTLAEAAWSGAAAGSFTQGGFDRTPGALRGTLSAAMNSDVGDPHVQSGFTVASTVGFVVTFNPGISSCLVGRSSATEQSSFTVGASKDTYFAVDTLSGNIAAYAVANLAAAPTKAPHEAWLTKVISGAGAITSTSNSIRTVTAIDGPRLHPETVGTRQTMADNWGRNFNSDYNQFSRGSAFEPDGWSVD